MRRHRRPRAFAMCHGARPARSRDRGPRLSRRRRRSALVQTRDVAPWSVWLLGELVRYDALVAPADPLGAFVMDLRAGRANAVLLDGHFVIFAWNADTREWHVWTNRFGTVHAYSALGARRSALGTFHPAVSKSVEAKRLDWSALSGFFAMGYFPEDRTHFEEVQILRPASHYVFDVTGLIVREERYWQWEHRPDRAQGFDAALERFGDTFGTVMRERTATGRIAVPISGGFDSRTAVALLPKDASRLWCYSYGYGSDSVETRIAREVAAARALACDAFEVDEYLFARMDDVLAATEGFNDVTQTRQVRVSRRAGRACRLGDRRALGGRVARRCGKRDRCERGARQSSQAGKPLAAGEVVRAPDEGESGHGGTRGGRAGTRPRGAHRRTRVPDEGLQDGHLELSLDRDRRARIPARRVPDPSLLRRAGGRSALRSSDGLRARAAPAGGMAEAVRS